MAVYDLFSKRQKQLRGEMPDVYQYDDIPQPLRIQIIHILRDALGHVYSSATRNYLELIYDILCREHGKLTLLEQSRFRMASRENFNRCEDVYEFIRVSNNCEEILDVVEFSFRLIDRVYRDKRVIYQTQPKISPDEAIEELNFRFREHGVGYQYESGEIIRVDSNLIHSEAVKPVLHLLSDQRFQGANQEFLQAHEHYRHGRYKESLNGCLKAFESTMKAICNNQGWIYQPTDTASRLIKICFQNNLIPLYLQDQFSSLKHNLESGVPTLRNKLGGHGQGSQINSVPQYFAAYQLHLTASTILFLIKAEKALL